MKTSPYPVIVAVRDSIWSYSLVFHLKQDLNGEKEITFSKKLPHINVERALFS